MSGNQKLLKYTSTLQLLHWLMVLLVAATFTFIELRALFPKGTDSRELMKLIHFSLGFSVLLLMIFRWFIRSHPNNQTAIAAIQPKTARYLHLTFYVLLIAMPILGWLTLNAEGKPLIVFMVELPNLIGENETLAKLFEETHEAIGKLLYVLIGVHVLAALAHQFIKKDNIINKMLR